MFITQKIFPVLITFNRSNYVEKTLQSFFDAGFTSTTFYVLDNASTDNTQEIVQNFQKKWPNLIYHRNKYNIGGNANILRAIELSDAEYHWVIGDDDEWYLNNLNEILEILESQSPDIIRLGWLVSDESRGKLLSAEKLAECEKYFFASTSMISATIIRRSLVIKYLRSAYQNISNFYPQLVPIILGSDRDNISVYTVKNNLMLHTPNDNVAYFLGDLEWYAIWFKTSLFFPTNKKRLKFNQETIHYLRYCAKGKKLGLPPILALTRVCVYFKSLGMSQSRYFGEILLYGKGVKRFFIIPAITYYCIPSFFAKFIRKIYEKLFHIKKNDPVRDETRC